MAAQSALVPPPPPFRAGHTVLYESLRFDVRLPYTTKYGNYYPCVTIGYTPRGKTMLTQFTGDELQELMEVRRRVEDVCNTVFGTAYGNYIEAGNGAAWRGLPRAEIPWDACYIEHYRPRGFDCDIGGIHFKEAHPASWPSAPPPEAYKTMTPDFVEANLIKPMRVLFASSRV